ncbi:helix-turn-helix domain-containing protein [Celeribacter naphthalenivorans]|uniref:helix-turn-helix domain-containing protein n=1 Tax=Celeribacter naphthalenivorans TaxID=1614694 RepID=UPI001CF98C19|nr:helix-turn-helix domain-containing protein [Celeribacter naphthalenivorans]
MRPKAHASHISTCDTGGLQPDQQVTLWQNYTQANVFRVRFHTVNVETLHGTQRNFETGSIHFSDMRVTPHVVERSEQDLIDDPCDMVLLIMVLEGEATYGQGGVWMTAQAGEILALRSDRAFQGIYTRAVRQMVMTLPTCEFTALCGREITGLERATQAQLGKKNVSWLSEQALASLSDTARKPNQVLKGLELVAALFGPSEGTSFPGQDRRMRPHFLAAQAWIADHLSDPALTPGQIAEALNISLRHLNRVFAREGVTVRQMIGQRRLSMALHLLQDPSYASQSIGQISYKCGFSDQSLFSRQFRRHFGQSPKAAREAARL